jgi:predicted esterase YcpF (UPF0227 family)
MEILNNPEVEPHAEMIGLIAKKTEWYRQMEDNFF